MATVAITPDQDVVTCEIFIAAPPARVFQAITDPNQMPRWWGQSDLYTITQWKADVRVGGKWSSDGVGADGTTFHLDGEYLEVDPPRLLVHTWSRKAFTACTRVVLSAPAPARCYESAKKVSRAIPPLLQVTPKAGSG
jgi:hypothetical protein